MPTVFRSIRLGLMFAGMSVGSCIALARPVAELLMLGVNARLAS
jgi:hypothetical protein